MLKESILQTHDVSIADPASNTILRFLILAQSSLSPHSNEETTERIRHFASLTGGSDCAIVLLLYDSTPSQPPTEHQPHKPPPSHALASLQSTLLTLHLTTPILPVASPAAVPRTISTFTHAMLRPRPQNPAAAAVPNAYADLLPLCSVRTPMSADMRLRLANRYASLRELARLGADGAEREVARLVREGAVEEQARDAVEFWEREFVVD